MWPICGLVRVTCYWWLNSAPFCPVYLLYLHGLLWHIHTQLWIFWESKLLPSLGHSVKILWIVIVSKFCGLVTWFAVLNPTVMWHHVKAAYGWQIWIWKSCGLVTWFAVLNPTVMWHHVKAAYGWQIWIWKSCGFLYPHKKAYINKYIYGCCDLIHKHFF